MRKILLSFILIVTFGAYTYLVRHPGPTSVTTETPPTNTDDLPPSIPTGPDTGIYKSGTFAGEVVDAFYGNVQVEVTIAGSRLTNVTFLDYPSDRQTSREKNDTAMPLLTSEAIKSQSADVDTVSGATYTSEAFKISLASALAKAKNIQ